MSRRRRRRRADRHHSDDHPDLFAASLTPEYGPVARAVIHPPLSDDSTTARFEAVTTTGTVIRGTISVATTWVGDAMVIRPVVEVSGAVGADTTATKMATSVRRQLLDDRLHQVVVQLRRLMTVIRGRPDVPHMSLPPTSSASSTLQAYTSTADRWVHRAGAAVVVPAVMPPARFLVAGHTWTFLADPPPAMHLATTDRRHVVWLEDGGDRVWRPDTTLPRWEIVALRHWLHEHRRHVERAWMTQVMIPMGWVDAYVSADGDVVIEGYAKTFCWFGVVVPMEEITVPITGNEDITIDEETGELILGVGLPRDEQQRVDLAERLWRPLNVGS